MVEEPGKSKQLIAVLQKVVDDTQRIIDETNDLIARLKTDIEDHQKFLDERRKELGILIKNLGIKKD